MKLLQHLPGTHWLIYDVFVMLQIKLSSFFDVTLKTAELKPTFISKVSGG